MLHPHTVKQLLRRNKAIKSLFLRMVFSCLPQIADTCYFCMTNKPIRFPVIYFFLGQPLCIIILICWRPIVLSIEYFISVTAFWHPSSTKILFCCPIVSMMAFNSCSLYCLAGLSEADASASCSFPSSASRASTLSSLCADSHASCFFNSTESLADDFDVG